MGSCNQCVQKQELQKSGRNQYLVVHQSPYNHQMAIRIQSAYRSYITRQKFNQKLAERRARNQIICNSTQDFLIEYHTSSYSPKINQFDCSNVYSSIQNNQKHSALSIFNRQQSLKLQPKESDSFDFEELDQYDQTPQNKLLQSPNKSLRSLLNQKRKQTHLNFVVF